MVDLINFFLKRVLLSFVTLWALASITFIFMRAIPGDPLTKTKEIPAAVRANLEERYGLNKPLWTQYTIQMRDIFFKGDFGESFRTSGRHVNHIIKENFLPSASVGILAVLFGTLTGLTLGVIAGLNRNSALDKAIMVFCVLGVSIPSALIAYVIQYSIGVLPLIKWGFDPDLWVKPVGYGEWRDLLLPSFTLSLGIITVMTRYMRSQIVDVSQAEYIKTAKAKGVSPLGIIFKHQIRNAILPVISLLGPIFVASISGSLLIETVFGIPGLGSAYMNSIANNDYNVLMGLTIFYGGFFILINLLTDILYGVIDPRIRMG